MNFSGERHLYSTFHRSYLYFVIESMKRVPSFVPPRLYAFQNPVFSARSLQLGAVARSCNPATWRLRLVDGVRTGVLPVSVPCRSGVRTKLGINMAHSAEAGRTRLCKEDGNRARGETQQPKPPVSSNILRADLL